MSRICEHADIQATPCVGSVFSRAIKCRAGQPNTCLRDCGEKCPAYKAKGFRKPVPSPFAGQPFPANRATAYSPNRETRAAFQPTVNTSTTKSGCATCGVTIPKLPAKKTD